MRCAAHSVKASGSNKQLRGAPCLLALHVSDWKAPCLSHQRSVPCMTHHYCCFSQAQIDNISVQIVFCRRLVTSMQPALYLSLLIYWKLRRQVFCFLALPSLPAEVDVGTAAAGLHHGHYFQWWLPNLAVLLWAHLGSKTVLTPASCKFHKQLQTESLKLHLWPVSRFAA